MRKKLLYLFIALLTLCVSTYALPTPDGDQPGEYYRVIQLPRVTQKTLPVDSSETHDAIRKVTEEPDRTVRAAALRAIAEIADEKDRELVIRMADDSVPTVRIEALIALSRISQPDFKRLAENKIASDPDAFVRQTAVRILGELKIGSEGLVAALKDKDKYVREAAVSAIGKAGGNVNKKVLPVMMKDTEFEVRAACATALADSNTPGAVGLLSSAITDRYPLVRAESIRALGRLDANIAVSKASEILKNDKSPFVLQAAVGVISLSTKKEHLDALHKMLNNKDMGVRKAAANACGLIGKTESVEKLADLLADEHYEVRTAARKALVEIGPDSGETLIKHLSHSYPPARREAAYGIGELKYGKATNNLISSAGDSDEEVRIISCWAIGRLGESNGAPALCKAAKDKSPAVRTEAARAIGIVGTDNGKEAVVSLLDDDDSRVIVSAARAAGRLKHPAESQLLKVLNNYKTVSSAAREAAAWALGELGSTQAVPFLKKLMFKKVIPVPMASNEYDSDSTRIQILLVLEKLDTEATKALLQQKDALSDGELLGGYWLKTAIAGFLERRTGIKYTFKKPGPTKREWFIRHIRERSDFNTHNMGEEPNAIVYPAQ